MPVSGPSKQFAYEQGEKATADIMDLLREKYGVCVPNDVVGSTKFRQDWHSAQQKLKEAVQELVWADHCCMF